MFSRRFHTKELNQRFKKHKLIFIVLLATMLFSAGCKESSDDIFNDNNINNNIVYIPAGEWKDDFGGGYNITHTTVEHFTQDSEWEGVVYPGVLLKGTINEVINFSPDSGVILIKITEEKNMNVTVGKYTAVYFRDFASNHVLLANPIDENYAPIEVETFDLAKSTFTIDNVATHVTHWGSGYTK